MTKSEALEKIRKLQAVAKSTSSREEAENAKRRCEELCKKYSISKEDLALALHVAAFDDLAERLESFARIRSDLPPIVSETIEKMRKGMSQKEKADMLGKVVGGVRIGSMLLGRAKMGPIKEIVDETLRRHEIVI
jgi:arginine utilization protein RocB